MRKMLKDLIDHESGGIDVDIRLDKGRWDTGRAVEIGDTGIAVITAEGASFYPWTGIEAVEVKTRDLRARGVGPLVR